MNAAKVSLDVAPTRIASIPTDLTNVHAREVTQETPILDVYKRQACALMAPFVIETLHVNMLEATDIGKTAHKSSQNWFHLNQLSI